MSRITSRALLVAILVASSTGLLTVPSWGKAETPPATEVSVPTPRCGPGETIRIKNLGAKRADATETLQRALEDDRHPCISIEDTAGIIRTGPLHIRHDNTHVHLAKGVVIADLMGAYPGKNDAMWRANHISGLSFSGYGATLRMNNSSYLEGEWRHVLSINSSSDVRIEGLRITGSGGDGIYLGDAGPNEPPDAVHHNSNVLIRNVTVHGARRNALSVISADNLLVEGSEFSGAEGTNPQYGIDFEPDRPSQRLSRILVRDVRLQDNAQGCVMWAPYRSDGTTQPFSAVMERFRCDHNGVSPGLTIIGPKVTDPGGSLTFRDGLISHGGWSGSASIALQHLPPTGTAVTFERVTVWNVGGKLTNYGYPDAADPMPPILVESGRLGNQADIIPEFGGTQFNDVVVVHDLESPFLATYKQAQWPSGVTGLNGRFTVFSPPELGRGMDLGDRAHDNDLELNAHVNAPLTWVSATAPERVRNCKATFTVARQSDHLDFPLAVRYELGGDASERLQTFGSAGLVVIPSGATSAEVTVSLNSAQGKELKNRLLTLTIQPSVAGQGLSAQSGHEWMAKKYYNTAEPEASVLLDKRSCR